ncbi:MAG: hypothetical protein J3K34DRAFT_438756, partial [Monoraphidium minutum]
MPGGSNRPPASWCVASAVSGTPPTRPAPHLVMKRRAPPAGPAPPSKRRPGAPAPTYAQQRARPRLRGPWRRACAAPFGQTHPTGDSNSPGAPPPRPSRSHPEADPRHPLCCTRSQQLHCKPCTTPAWLPSNAHLNRCRCAVRPRPAVACGLCAPPSAGPPGALEQSGEATRRPRLAPAPCVRPRCAPDL